MSYKWKKCTFAAKSTNSNAMKKIFLILLVLTTAIFLRAQNERLVGENCTSIMVGKKASADGSVITSHTCDSKYRTWITIEPAADHKPGTMHKVYKGTMHTETPKSMENLVLAGEIPEVAHTFAYMNTAYPCMNEKQLAMGESTFSGPDTLRNPDAMFMIEELQRIALQRCATAREAISVIAEMIEKYGYADGGECITIADKSEVWQMEIIGEGRDVLGGLWVAKRVPDDEVAVSCNVPRIGKLERKDKDNFLCSDNIEKVALKYGLWDGKGEFLWWKAFNASYAEGKNHKEREWYIFNTLAPSLNLDINAEALPFSIKPEKKVAVRDVMELFRATYEGTELDQIANLKMVVNRKDKEGKPYADTVICPNANPWMDGNERAMYNFLQPNTVTFYRGIAMSWCSYSFIMQCRDWLPDEVGGLCWLSIENPGQSPRIPFFSGNTRMPAGFNVCGHHRYNDDAVLWHYRKANKLAQVRWGRAKKMMMDNVMRYEDKAFDELPELERKAVLLLKSGKREEAQKLLDRYSSDFAGATRQTWREMEHKLWETYWTGF